MANFATFTHIGLLMVLMFWTTGSTGAIPFDEEILQIVKVQVKDAVKSIESKVAELESKNVEMQEKINELQAKVKEQDSLLTVLLQEKNERMKTNSASISQSAVAINGLPSSCGDLRMIGHIWSGLYLVMEDELVKNVYCDFTKLSNETGFQSLIGYAEVKPKPTYFGIPTSCANLKGAGHTSSGLYSVKGEKMIESVYCDFTKTTSDAEFEKWIGFADVKSAPVNFYVQRNSSFTKPVTPIPFDLAVVNEGNAMDLKTGKFTAPRNGIYFFSFTGHAHFPASTSRVYLYVHLFLNGGLIGEGYVSDSNNADMWSPLTLQSTLNLKKGDQLWLEIWGGPGTTGVYLSDDSALHWTHFTGFMLEEEIVASLF